MKKTTTKTRQRKNYGELSACKTLGVDLAKNVFQVAGENARGEIVLERKLRSRDAFHAFAGEIPGAMKVLMEPGPGAQAWARMMQHRGLMPQLLPAQHVAEHRSGAKNDRNDALALLRAGHDRNVHPVPIKTVAALELQATHRVRTGYLRRRTAISNQIRGLLLEHGIALPRSARAMTRVGDLLGDAAVPLPDGLRELIAQLLGEWEHKGEQIERLDGVMARAAKAEPVAQRLMTMRGVGPVCASALLAKQTEPQRFASARQFAAYFGAVPEQHSTGGKTRLGKMSKRGDGYLRSLFIQGAHAVLRQLDPTSTHPDDRRLQRWMHRVGRKGAAVRLANRNLRIAWVLLQTGDTYHRDGRSRAPTEEEAA